MYDWLLAVPDEHAILAKSGFSWSNTIYFMSRYVDEFNTISFLFILNASIASLCLLISAAISSKSNFRA